MGHFKGEQRLFKTAPKKYGAEDDSVERGAGHWSLWQDDITISGKVVEHISAVILKIFQCLNHEIVPRETYLARQISATFK